DTLQVTVIATGFREQMSLLQPRPSASFFPAEDPFAKPLEPMTESVAEAAAEPMANELAEPLAVHMAETGTDSPFSAQVKPDTETLAEPIFRPASEPVRETFHEMPLTVSEPRHYSAAAPAAGPYATVSASTHHAAAVVGGEGELLPEDEGPSLSRFLSPVTVREMKPVELKRSEPARVESVAQSVKAQMQNQGGFQSDSFMDDLNEPAYTRKYMD
ncbi:MAG: hypothetical protein ABIF77_19025, partial [bacterium]